MEPIPSQSNLTLAAVQETATWGHAAVRGPDFSFPSTNSRLLSLGGELPGLQGAHIGWNEPFTWTRITGTTLCTPRPVYYQFDPNVLASEAKSSSGPRARPTDTTGSKPTTHVLDTTTGVRGHEIPGEPLPRLITGFVLRRHPSGQ